MGTFGADANGEVTSGMNHKGESTKAAPRDGTLRSSDEAGESRGSEGGVCSEATSVGPTRRGRSLKDEAKPFCISRREVWEAYLKVKSNKGPRGGGALVPAARAVNKTALLRRARETLWAECQHSRLKPLPLKCPHKPETLSVSEFRPIRRNSGQWAVNWNSETVETCFWLPSLDAFRTHLSLQGSIPPAFAGLYQHLNDMESTG
jgi:hypothetical protein